MKSFIIALRAIAVMTLLTGLVYCLLVAALSSVLFPAQADGSLVKRGDVVVGSELVGQSFSGAGYFWGRPSAVGYNPMPSGGSNQSATSAALKDAVAQRRAVLDSAHVGAGPIPVDLLTASASGLDPHISPEAALYQVERVARDRGLDAAGTDELRKLVNDRTEPPQWGIFGEPRVHVLKLNLAVDAQWPPSR